MARDISELGADVFDDTIVQSKHRLSPKKRNYIVGLSITGVLLIGLVIAIVILCNTALTDYSNVRNVRYYYTPASLLKEGEKTTLTLYKLDDDKTYPSTFRVPSQVKGYKVTAIGDGAFAGHEEIKRVIIPSSVEYIGTNAFKNCTNLSKFTFSKNITYVGENAFLETAWLKKQTSDTTKNCVLPSGVLISVGKDVFKKNTALISDGLTTQEINNIVTKYGADSNEVINFSDLNIKYLASGAFKNNDKIVYLDLPKSVDSLPNSIFEGCSNLKGFDSTNSNIATIGEKAFKGCKKLVDIHMSEGIVSLGTEAFANTGLVDTLPDISKVPVEGMGLRVFANCESLTQITYPIDVVPQGMFKDCSSLTKITWGENNSLFDQVKTFGNGAFEGTGFETFRVPSSINTISDDLFKNAKNLKTIELYGNPTNKIVEGSAETSKYIDENGNEQAGTLQGVASIKTAAFQGCESLTTIALYDDNHNVYKSEVGTFNFPNSLRSTNQSSTNDDSHAFEYSKAKKIVFGNNVRNIGVYCFANMSELTDVVLPEKGSLALIDKSAFENDVKLENINLVSSITTIGASTFKGCTSLKHLNLQDTSISTLQGELLYNCESLESVSISSKVTSIKTNSFYNTLALKKIYIPSTVKTIAQNSFVTSKNVTRDEPLKIYVQKTYTEVASLNDYANKKVKDDEGNETITWLWHDGNCEVYYTLGEGETPVEGVNYWDGVMPQ